MGYGSVKIVTFLEVASTLNFLWNAPGIKSSCYDDIVSVDRKHVRVENPSKRLSYIIRVTFDALY